MYKRVMAIILTCLIGFGGIKVSANTPDILLNEVFDDYAFNYKPNDIDISGTDARVVQVKESNKALYGKVWGAPVVFDFPASTTSKVVTYSFDLMIKGDDVLGNILKLSNTTSLLKLNENGSIELEDGYKIGGRGNGVWHSYTAKIDFTNKMYDMYVDGEKKLSNWVFNTKPVKPDRINFTFMPVNDDSITEIFVDNVRVYCSESIMEKSDFPLKAPNNETVDFTPATEKMKYDKVFIDSRGSEGLPETIFAKKDNAVTELGVPPTGGSPCLHVLQMGTSDPFIDCLVNFDEPLYIFQTDVYIASVSDVDGCGLQIVYPQGEGTSSTMLIRDSKGMLKCDSQSLNVFVPVKKWVRFAVACNRFTSKIDVYMDGKLLKSGIDVSKAFIKPEKFRMGFYSRATSEKNNEVYFNNVKLYAGNEIRDFEDAINNESVQSNQGTLVSRGEKPTAAKNIIGSGAVFMTNCDFCFYDGEKRTYSELNMPPSYEDEKGVIMVPAELLSRGLHIPINCENGVITALGKNISIGTVGELDAAPIEKDGVVFVPAVSFTEKILNRNAYVDGRYFVFVSSEEIKLSNSNVVTTNREQSDVLYRYMQYQRPSGDVVYDAIVQNSYKTHPRLFIRNVEIPQLREKLQNTPELKEPLYALLSKCEQIIESKPTEYKLNGFRLFTPCNAVREIIVNLSIAYYATGDEKYLDRMWIEAQNALEWKDWNTSQHFLDSGEIGAGMALAYDTLYDYLTEEQKEYFRKRICELYIDVVINEYCRSEMLVHSNLTRSNWGAVCFNSILLTALTFIDEEPEDSEFTQKCKFLAAETIQALEYPLGNLMPDGSICDGIGYLGYYSESLSWSLNALNNVCGNDYGLIDGPCYKQIVDYAMYIQTANGCFNMSDTPRGKVLTNSPEMFLNAKLSNDPAKMALVNNMRKEIGGSLNAHSLLWYEPTEGTIDYSSYPLDRVFPGQQIVTMRSTWGDSDFSFLAAIGGQNMLDQSHFDKGSFNLDLGGVRWFEDLGADNYNVKGGYFGEAGFTLYRVRTEGHNSLVINPSKDDPGQTLGGYAPLSYMKTKDKGAIAVYDLKDVYQGKVNYYNRGFYLGEDRNTLIVRDELELTEANNDIYWFLHTSNSKIQISADKKSAIIEKDGKKLKVDVICDASDWKLEARDATYLFEGMDRGDEYSRDEYSKIALVGKASGKLNISAKFYVLDDGNTYAPLTDTPISEWSIPDGELVKKPRLDSISINGKLHSDYVSNKYEYVIEVSADDTVPVIEGYSNSGKVSVKQAESLQDVAVITFTSPNGTKKEYTIKFNVNVVVTDNIMNIKPKVGLPDDAEFATISNYVVNHEQTTNPAPGAVDGDMSTRWSSDLSGAFYDVDLGAVCDLAGVGIVFAEGDTRYYKYDLLVSDDKIHYTRIFSGTSASGTKEWEFLPFNRKARYVRYVGYGHADGEWNNLVEFRPCLLK